MPFAPFRQAGRLPLTSRPAALCAAGAATLLAAAAGLEDAAPASAANPVAIQASATDHIPPGVSVRVLSRRRTTLRFKGLPATVTLNEPGSVSVVVQDPHHRQISAANTGIASVPEGGSTTVHVRMTQRAKTKLRHQRKIRWTVVATGTDGVGNKTVKRARLWIG